MGELPTGSLESADGRAQPPSKQRAPTASFDSQDMEKVSRPLSSPGAPLSSPDKLHHWKEANVFEEYIQNQESCIRAYSDPGFKLQLRKWMYIDDRNLPRYKRELQTLGSLQRYEMNRRFGGRSTS